VDYAFISMHGYLCSTKEIKSLTLFICFKWIKEILVALFDEMVPTFEIYAKTMSHVPDTSAFIIICLNKSRSEPGNAPRIGIGHREVVCRK